MIYIGNHVSRAGGYAAMGRHEKALGGNTFAYFTRNPRGGNVKTADPEDLAALRKFLREERFGKLVAHAPYTMNLCSAKEEVRAFSRRIFAEDLTGMEQLPGNFLNFHPGSHTGLGAAAGIRLITEALNETLRPDQTTMVLLETMAGKGTEVGRSFDELAAILAGIRPELADRVGVCLDTCHVWNAGYDIRGDLDGVLAEFDEKIGLERLYAVHLNDSRNACGSRKDRHEKLGEGEIGLEALLGVVRHPALEGRPFILETPNDDEGYRREIAMVKDAEGEK